MKYLKLFENFEEGHKFDILDLFTITPSEVKKLFFKELDRNNPDMENIQVFLESGLVDVNTKDDQNRTPLHWVAINNLLKVAKLLISFGADLEAKSNRDFTPLHMVAANNSLEVAELLISSGADLNAKSNNDQTPLHFAADWNSLEVAELLISSGAELEAEDNWDRTPLHWAASQEMRELLKSHGGVQ